MLVTLRLLTSVSAMSSTPKAFQSTPQRFSISTDSEPDDEPTMAKAAAAAAQAQKPNTQQQPQPKGKAKAKAKARKSDLKKGGAHVALESCGDVIEVAGRQRPRVWLDDVFSAFESWLTKQTGAQVHGHLFAKDRAHFADDGEVYRGGLSDNARLRDYNGKMFLTNLIWNGRDHHHCFQFGPADSQDISWTLAKDTNASIWVISGAWAIPLFASGRSASDIRAEAARLQRIEDKFLKVLRSPEAHARIKIMTLAEFVEAPMDVLQTIIDEIAGHRGNAIKEVPHMPDLTGFPDFLQDLKNQGMHPFLTGDMTVGHEQQTTILRKKPYVISGK